MAEKRRVPGGEIGVGRSMSRVSAGNGVIAFFRHPSVTWSRFVPHNFLFPPPPPSSPFLRAMLQRQGRPAQSSCHPTKAPLHWLGYLTSLIYSLPGRPTLLKITFLFLRHQPFSFQPPYLSSHSIGGKFIGLFDLRTGTHTHRIAAKSPHSLTLSPFEPYLLACHSRLSGDIEFYDIRQFNSVLSTVTNDNSLSQMAWCPTRSDLFFNRKPQTFAITLKSSLAFLPPRIDRDIWRPATNKSQLYGSMTCTGVAEHLSKG